MREIFGALLGSTTIEQEIIARVKPWTATYLTEVATRTGRDGDAFPNIRAWKRASRWPMSIPEEQIPLAIVVSPGSAEVPLQDGDGVYSARLAVAVGVLVQSADDETARSLADDYGLAVAAATLHKATDSPLIAGIAWRGFTSDDGPRGDLTVATRTDAFWIDLDEVLSSAAGPDQADPEPDPQHPYPDYGRVETVEITLDVEDVPQ